MSWQALEDRRPQIRATWERLLRIEPVNSPLGNPDTLVYLLDQTLDEFFRDVRSWSPRRHPHRADRASCSCGRNPLYAYFTSGRQAVREALVLVQASMPTLSATERDLAFRLVEEVFDFIAHREINAFCAVCQFRHVEDACRVPVVSGLQE